MLPVAVENFGFSPSTVTVVQGGTVTGQFKDSVDHTSTSNQRFWNSAPKGAATRARTSCGPARATTAGT